MPNGEPSKEHSLATALEEAETRLLHRTQPEGYREFESLLRRMQAPQLAHDAREASAVTMRICQKLYLGGRSFDALPFARANLILAENSGDDISRRRSHTASGLLLADTGDVAGAIEHHSRALHYATDAHDDVEMSRVWNNIGAAFCVSGNFALALPCFKRVLALVPPGSEPVFSRYAAYGNLSHCHFQLDALEEGYRYAMLATRELTPAIIEQDPYNALVLYRNFARLLVAMNRLDEAKEQAAAALAMAARIGSPRATIAATTAQAAYEMASGNTDTGLTRLDQALQLARSVPAMLRDTLVCVIRAEEKGGFPALALMRLQELSDLVYRTGIEQARRHVELAEVLGTSAAADSAESTRRPATNQPLEQTKARLTSRLPIPTAPAEWKTLQRLAVSAAVRIDTTGWHGIRVGALTQALAIEFGVPLLQALEFGLAAQLHDIGMASVPEAVLMQAGTLNEVERELVRKHTTAGSEMLAGDLHPRMIIAGDMVKYHHARWDGEGYPAAVSGNAIPLTARICAVADTYDTLVTDRPWRKACSMERALRELRNVAGTQLDPDLVRCFEVVIRREAANEGIDPSVDGGLENFQKLITALTEDRDFI